MPFSSCKTPRANETKQNYFIKLCLTQCMNSMQSKLPSITAVLNDINSNFTIIEGTVGKGPLKVT